VTPEEVAAVTAVTVALQQRDATSAGFDAPGEPPVSAWVDASRRAAQRALMQRGSWRLSSRLGRRSRT
jgi:hypothetical protein